MPFDITVTIAENKPMTVVVSAESADETIASIKAKLQNLIKTNLLIRLVHKTTFLEDAKTLAQEGVTGADAFDAYLVVRNPY